MGHQTADLERMDTSGTHARTRGQGRTSLRRRFALVGLLVLGAFAALTMQIADMVQARSTAQLHGSVDKISGMIRADAVASLDDDLHLTHLLGSLRASNDVVDTVLLDGDGRILADGTQSNLRRGMPFEAGNDDLLSETHGHSQSGEVYESRWPLLVDGEVVGAFAMSVDLTEQHAELALMRLQLMLGGLGIALASFMALYRLVRHSEEAIDELAAAARNAADEQELAADRAARDPDGDGAVEPVVIRIPRSTELARLGEAMQRYRSAVARTSAATVDRMRANAECFAALIDQAPDLVMLLDRDGLIAYASPAAMPVLGRSPEDLFAARLLSFVRPADQTTVQRGLQRAAAHPGRPVSIEFHVPTADGEHLIEAVIRDLQHDPAVQGIVCNARDVSSRHAAEESLRHQALHDALTGLPNRTLLLDRLSVSLGRARRDGTTVAVFMMDLDGFKLVNDAYGHEVGDRLLIAAARRLESVVREGDTAVRLGGDEFVVLSEGLKSDEDVAALARRYVDAIGASAINIDDRELHVRASIGVRLSRPGDAAGDILRDADAAMYAAKRDGGGIAVSDEQHQRAAARHLELSTDVRRGLGLGQFTSHYQPIVDLETGEIVSLEALARWEHPDRGNVPPMEFIPICEETGLIGTLGLQVFDQACHTAKALEERGRPLPITVNVSPRQLAVAHFVDDVAAIMKRVGVEPSLLAIEVTESVMLGAAEPLERLRDLGLRILIDDFGTGYSSLSYLHRFRADALKIDRSFVSGIGAGRSENREIVRAMLGMASAFGLSVIAEGVETDEERQGLAELGVDMAQGYLYAHPAPIGELFPELDLTITTSTGSPLRRASRLTRSQLRSHP